MEPVVRDAAAYSRATPVGSHRSGGLETTSGPNPLDGLIAAPAASLRLAARTGYHPACPTDQGPADDCRRPRLQLRQNRQSQKSEVIALPRFASLRVCTRPTGCRSRGQHLARLDRSPNCRQVSSPVNWLRLASCGRLRLARCPNYRPCISSVTPSLKRYSRLRLVLAAQLGRYLPGGLVVEEPPPFCRLVRVAQLRQVSPRPAPLKKSRSHARLVRLSNSAGGGPGHAGCCRGPDQSNRPSHAWCVSAMPCPVGRRGSASCQLLRPVRSGAWSLQRCRPVAARSEAASPEGWCRG